MHFNGLNIHKTLNGKLFDVHLCDDTIVVIVTQQNSSIDVEDIQEMLRLIATFGLEGKSKLLSVAGQYSELTAEAQKFMRTEAANVNKHIKEAVFVNSLAQRIIGNFYLKIVSANRPSKLFTSITKAIEWLKNWIVMVCLCNHWL